MSLKILPLNVANMIAAGEVVQRPSSVVKELMENAVDAGANQIKVVITDAGRTLIQVIDNGCGMSPDDAVLCFERHATSKIAAPEDLNNISSYGFRGEALASIAAVADVTLKTRSQDAEVGCVVEFSASKHLSTTEAAMPVGSNFSIRNLFFNIPARRKFLKSDNVEFKHIIEEFQRVALTRPEIGFSLTHNGKEVYVLKPAKMLKFRILDLLGTNVTSDLVDVSANTSVVDIEGFVGRPDTAKKTLGNQFFFVNGRYFRSPYLHKAVMKAYQDFIPDGVTPSYFIYMNVDPHSIDVNIHPTKTEIKFEDDSVIFQILYACLKETLGKNSFSSSIDFNPTEETQIPSSYKYYNEFHQDSVPAIDFDPTYNPFDIDHKEWEDTSKYIDKKEDYGVLFEEKVLPSTKIIILQGKYIITPAKSGLMVVNIRRAWERILYERFLGAITKNDHITQVSLFPVTMQVGVEGRTLFDENAAMLLSLGFDISPFGTDTIVVNGVPEGFSNEAGKVQTMISDLMIALSDAAPTLPGVMESATASKFATLGSSSSSEIKSPMEAQKLIDTLFSCENAEYTVSGKKIISLISIEDLDRKF